MSPARQLAIFFAIAFGWAWVIEACMILAKLPVEVCMAATLGPALGAVIAQRLASGNLRAFRWNVSWPRTLAAAVLGIALVMICFSVLPALATVDARKLHWGGLFSFDIYNYSTLLGGPLFEEPGWRGFALPRLEARTKPLPAALLLGAIWTTWHLPLFWYPGWTSLSFPLYLLMVTSFSVILTLAANVARFGVIAPILMHAAFNSTGGYLNALFRDVKPGSGGFLPLLAPTLHFNLSISFEALIGIGGAIGALALTIATGARLGAEAGSRR